jgi:hypothetical protein
MSLHQLVDPERSRRSSADAGDLLSMVLEYGHQLPGSPYRLLGGLGDSRQEEFHPGLPGPCRSERKGWLAPSLRHPDRLAISLFFDGMENPGEGL